MTLQKAILEIDATINGTEVTGEFHMVGNLTVSEQTNIDYIAGNAASNVSNVFERITGDTTRSGIYIDLGAGTHIFEIDFMGWEGATDSDGNDLPWGDTTKSKPSVFNATTAEPVTQVQVFHRYLRSTTIDSINPARLYVGEYHSTGLPGFDDVMYVAPRNPRGTKAAQDFSTWDGTFTLVEVEPLDTVKDAAERLGI